MIKNINNVKKISKFLANNKNVIEFNNRLPVSIDVQKKLDYTRYALKMGSREITTKSFKELEIGAKYWGELHTNAKASSMNLSNLHKKPPFLQKETLPVAIEFDVLLQKVLTDKKPTAFVKEAIMEKMAHTEDKEEFTFLTNLLLSLQHDVLTIPFKVYEKYNLFQMRKRKALGKNSFMIDFYATFNNLGELSGQIVSTNGSTTLYLKTQFELVRNFLLSNIDELNYFSNIEITKAEVAPLYVISDKLLDIKG